MANEEISQTTDTQPQRRPVSLGKPQHRPERPVRRYFSWIFSLSGCLLIGGGIFLWQGVFHPTSDRALTSTAQAPGACGSRLPFDWISQQLPPYLHLMVAEVTSRVRAGQDIQDIVAAQGVSPQQLYGIETKIMQDANARWINQGCISQQNARENMRRFQALTMTQVNENFTDFYKRKLS